MKRETVRKSIFDAAAVLNLFKPEDGYITALWGLYGHEEKIFNKTCERIKKMSNLNRFPSVPEFGGYFYQVKQELKDQERVDSWKRDDTPEDERATQEDWDRFQEIGRALGKKFNREI